jgi:hypothetical protein
MIDKSVRDCPICNRVASPKFKPFCSHRCADVDLARWLNGNYAIPAVEPPDDFSEFDDSGPFLVTPDNDA